MAQSVNGLSGSQSLTGNGSTSLINDAVTTNTLTWSSTKINAEIGGGGGGSVNPLTTNIVPDANLTRSMGTNSLRMSDVYSGNVNSTVVQTGQIRDMTGASRLDLNTAATVVTSGKIRPTLDGVDDLGESGRKYKDAYIDTLTVDSIWDPAASMVVDLTTAGDIRTSADIKPSAHNTYDIGADLLRLANIYSVYSNSNFIRTNEIRELVTDTLKIDISPGTMTTSGKIRPENDGEDDLGELARRYRDAYVDTVTTDSIWAGPSLVVDLTTAGDITTSANIKPSANNTYDIGDSTNGFANTFSRQLSYGATTLVDVSKSSINTMQMPVGTSITGINNTVLGYGIIQANNPETSAYNTIVGYGNNWGGTGAGQSIALGANNAVSTNTSNITIGNFLTTFGNSLAIGGGAGGRSTTLGMGGSTSNQDQDTCLGFNCRAFAGNCTLVGAQNLVSTITHNDCLLLGVNLTSAAAGDVAMGSGSYVRGNQFGTKHWSPEIDNDVDLGVTGTKRWRNLFLSGNITCAGTITASTPSKETIALRITIASLAIAAGTVPWNNLVADVTTDYSTSLGRFTVQYQTVPSSVGPTFRNDSGGTRTVKVSMCASITTGTGATGVLDIFVDTSATIGAAASATKYCVTNTSSNVVNAQTYKMSSEQIIQVPNGYYIRPFMSSARIMNTNVDAAFSIEELA